jgi:hypothetical protein
VSFLSLLNLTTSTFFNKGRFILNYHKYIKNYNEANFYNLMNDIYPANMFLQSSLASFKDPKQSFPREIKKHVVVDIFVLNLRLMARGHVFGAFLLRVLERDPIRSVVRRLSVDLLRACLTDPLFFCPVKRE